MPHTGALRLPIIKSRSIVMPDSSVILHYVFEEEEFKPKIEYFLDIIKKAGIPCEILPEVNRQIIKKLMQASQEYIRTLRRCKSWLRKIVVKPLASVQVEKAIIEKIERAFAGVIEEIERKHFPQARLKFNAVCRARVVETSVVLEVINILTEPKQPNLESFFDMLEDKFSEKYTDFCDKQSSFMKNIGATTIRNADLLPATTKLQGILSKKCGISRPSDVTLLCESISRMYQENRWCSVVTTDYRHIVKNRLLIDRYTLLIASDLIYFLYHLDKKIDLALYPRDGATKMGIQYSSFINFPKPPVGVI